MEMLPQGGFDGYLFEIPTTPLVSDAYFRFGEDRILEEMWKEGFV
jgi:hypothetical protein